MKNFIYIIGIFLLISINKMYGMKRSAVLIFSKTAGFHHNSIRNGIAAITQLGKENKFDVDTTTNSAVFTAANLKKYRAVIFLSTTGDVLNDEQQLAFQQYIQNGGGYVGIHAATDCEYNWPWYGKLSGAYFKAHPEQQEAVLQIIDHHHPSTKHLPDTWKRKDEWYNFKDLSPDVHVLIKIDETSYQPGKEKMGDHPVAWFHEYDGGRAFYTALGHTEESYADPLFLQHILGGIQYAMGGK